MEMKPFLLPVAEQFALFSEQPQILRFVFLFLAPGKQKMSATRSPFHFPVR
jgi:hypothetical protein